MEFVKDFFIIELISHIGGIGLEGSFVLSKLFSSFHCSGLRLQNSLPKHVRRAASLGLFQFYPKIHQFDLALPQ